MKSIIYVINESLKCNQLSFDDRNFIEDCLYDLITSNVYKSSMTKEDIVNNIIQAIDELSKKRKYILLKKILITYPDNKYKENINSIIDSTIKKYYYIT